MIFCVLCDPPLTSQRLFKTRTTLFYTIASTLHAAAFIPSNVLLPQFFQGVHNSDALQAGIQLLPFAIFVSWSTVVAGQIQSRLRIVRPITWFGYAVAILGFGLMFHYFNYDITKPMQYGLTIIPAVGVGLSLQSPMLILQAAMPLKDMAAVTSAWVLTRSIGGSVGVSVFTAILNSDMRSNFAQVQAQYGSEAASVPTSAAGYAAMHEMPDGEAKNAVLAAFADSFKPCWLVGLALLAICLVITIPTRAYSLNRPRGAAAAAAAGGVEEEAEAEAEDEKAGYEGADEKAYEGADAKVGAVDADTARVQVPHHLPDRARDYSIASTPTATVSLSDKERSRSRSRERAGALDDEKMLQA